MRHFMTSNPFTASLIIAFYNNINALRTILLSLEKQNKNNFEIIIADDGSHKASLSSLNELIKNSSLSIQHIRQLDIGFRKNRILNKAISISKSDYLIFIDGDCIPQTDFILDHLKNRTKRHILNGRRIDLPASFADKLHSSSNPEKFYKHNITKIFFLYIFQQQGKNIEKGLNIKNKFIFNYLNQRKKAKGIVGCNFSAYKSDIIAVNGFNNQYEVPSIGEDSDIEYRLLLNGIQIKNIFYQANILHLIHEELPRLQAAADIYDELLITNKAVTENGLEEAFNED